MDRTAILNGKLLSTLEMSVNCLEKIPLIIFGIEEMNEKNLFIRYIHNPIPEEILKFVETNLNPGTTIVTNDSFASILINAYRNTNLHNQFSIETNSNFLQLKSLLSMFRAKFKFYRHLDEDRIPQVIQEFLLRKRLVKINTKENRLNALHTILEAIKQQAIDT